MGPGPQDYQRERGSAMLKMIVKRSGEKVPFDASKIRGAIFKANVRKRHGENETTSSSTS